MAIRDPKEIVRSPLVAPHLTNGVFIHPQAVVEQGATIGPRTKIWRFSHIRTGAVLGEDCIVGNYVFVDVDVHIGSRVKIQNCGILYAGVTVEDEVFIGPNVTFTNDRFPRAMNIHWEIVPTRVCHGASIGANATVVCGVTIAPYAMVAAGSVVTKDVAPFLLVRGNPAQPAGFVCPCGRKLQDSTTIPVAPVRCECGCVVDLATARVLLPQR